MRFPVRCSASLRALGTCVLTRACCTEEDWDGSQRVSAFGWRAIGDAHSARRSTRRTVLDDGERTPVAEHRLQSMLANLRGSPLPPQPETWSPGLTSTPDNKASRWDAPANLRQIVGALGGEVATRAFDGRSRGIGASPIAELLNSSSVGQCLYPGGRTPDAGILPPTRRSLFGKHPCVTEEEQRQAQAFFHDSPSPAGARGWGSCASVSRCVLCVVLNSPCACAGQLHSVPPFLLSPMLTPMTPRSSTLLAPYGLGLSPSPAAKADLAALLKSSNKRVAVRVLRACVCAGRWCAKSFALARRACS